MSLGTEPIRKVNADDEALVVPGFGVRLARWWIRCRWLCLAVALVLVVAAWVPARQLQMDRALSTMFAPDDPILEPFARLKRTFGGGQVILAAYELDAPLPIGQDGSPSRPEAQAVLDELEDLRERLAAVQGVDAVLTLTDSPARRAILDEDAEAYRALFEGMFLGPDLRTLALLVFLDESLPTTDGAPNDAPEWTRAAAVEALRVASQTFGREVYLIGEPVIVEDGFAYVAIDGARLGWATSVLLGLVILLVFRSLRWMLLPLVIVQSALIWTQAVLHLGAFRLTMVSSMLAAIVTVVGVATVVHLILAFREQRDAGRRGASALLAASVLLAAPVFWSLTTTAIGFMALATSRVGPVQSFGTMMALGTVITGLAVLLWTPGVVLLGRFDRDPQHPWGNVGLSRGLLALVESLNRRPWLWGTLTVALAAVCAAGYPRLQVETDFTKNFRSDTPVVTSYQFVETRLGGGGVWDIVLPMDEGLDDTFLERVRELEQRLRDEVPELTKITSLADVFDAVGEYHRLTSPARRFIARFLTPERKLRILQNQAPTLAESLIGDDPIDDGRYYRIMLRSREQLPSDVKERVIAQVETLTHEVFPEGEVTGFYVLLASLVESLLADQLKSLLVAAIGIALAMTLALRSLRLAVIALVPNTLPVFVALGVMGHLGLKINMGTVMIAAVSLGLSIDSSIHYLTRFRRHLAAGLDRDPALEATHLSVGRSILISSLALITGFLVLLTSDFVPTIYFGGLIAAALVGGLLGNLVLLPLLVKLVWPARSRPRASRATRTPQTTQTTPAG